MALHPEAKVLITERMKDTAKERGVPFDADRHDNIHRLNMGVFPVGADVILNPYNKIPGFTCWADAGAVQSRRAGPPQAATPRRPATGLANLSSDPKNRRGGIHFLPGFPVMAWPMMEGVLDTLYLHLHQKSAYVEKSIIVFGSMEATLTPLMLELEAKHAGIKVFSLPSVDHPTYGRHIELGVKGMPDAVGLAYPALLAGLAHFDFKLGPELVRS